MTLRRSGRRIGGAILLVLGGLQGWTAGQTSDDGTPAADPFEALPSYQFGGPRTALVAIERQVRKGDDRAGLEARLLAVLQAPDASLDARRFCCRMLEVIGSADSVPLLADLLGKSSLSEPARRALHAMPGESVDLALLTAAEQVSDSRKVSLLQTMGARRSALALAWIESQLQVDDDLVRRAALWALGRIGGVTAALALENAELPDRLNRDRGEALLDCADRWITDGQAEHAIPILRKLLHEPHERSIQAAARRALIVAQPDQATEHVLAMLTKDDPFWIEAGVSGVSQIDSPATVLRLADSLSALPDLATAPLITVLADRGLMSTAPVIALQLDRPSPPVQNAALAALRKIGGAEQVTALTAFAAANPDRVDDVTDTLSVLRGPQVDPALIATLSGTDPAARTAAIRALGARHCTNAIPLLLKMAQDSDFELRVEARAALAPMITHEQWPALLEMVLYAQTPPDLEEVIELSVTAWQRMEPGAREQGLVEATSEHVVNRSAIALITGHFPSDATLARLTHIATEDPSQSVRESALQALATWPNPAPWRLLRDGIETMGNTPSRPYVLDGLLRLAVLTPDLSADERRELFEHRLLQALDDEEKATVLRRCGDVNDPWVLPFLQRFADSESLGAIAAPVLEDRWNALSRQHPHDASGRPVTWKKRYADKYPASGDGALTDDRYGSTAFGDGVWQGYRGVNLNATVDLGAARTITDVRVGFLQDHESWIFLPLAVDVEVSSDGQEFRSAGSWQREAPTEHGEQEILDVRVHMNEPDVTHVRVIARHIRMCPAWHPGAGQVAWMFVDELQVNSHLGR